jgi:hypothetical protein
VKTLLALSAILALGNSIPVAADSSQNIGGDSLFSDDVSASMRALNFARPQSSGRTAAVADAQVKIPLTLRNMDSGDPDSSRGQAAVSCSFNGANGACLLDTGAGVDVIFKGSWNSRLPVASRSQITGASNSALGVDMVKIADFRVGGMVVGEKIFRRVDRDRANPVKDYLGIIGAETLSLASRFSLRFTRIPELVINPEGPAAGGGSFSTSSENQIIMALPLGDSLVHSLFDTGCESSIVDLAYAKAHPDQFQPLSRSARSVDATGSKDEVEFYRARSLRIGSVEFPSATFVAFDFKGLRESVGNSDIDAILGYDIISRLDWTFDWKAHTWVSSSGVTIQSAENRPPKFDDAGAAVDSALSSLLIPL